MESFSKLGHHVFIIIIRPENKKPRITSFKEKNLDVIEIHPPSIGVKGKKGLLKHLKYLACIPTVSKIASKIIKEKNFDFVYSYMPGTGSSVPAMRIKSKNKIKFVLDLADMYTMVRPKIVVDKSFRNADKIIVITNYLKEHLINKGIESEKIQVIPNGVDLQLFDSERYNKNEIRKIRDEFKAEKLILFSGSLQDLNIIINSAIFVIDKFPNVKYVIIGDHRDPKRSVSSWKKIVKKKNLESYFEFLGRKPREEIPKYLLCADICLDSFPDEPYFAAAHPIKLLEYGACKKAIVATNVAETKKILQHEKYGLLAKPGDPKDYAKNIITLLNSPELGTKMGNEFSKYVKENFDWNKIVVKLENFLEN